MDRFEADGKLVRLTEEGLGTRLKARIIIPVWGVKYVRRLEIGCLPSLLAPGNLPHLAGQFDCELVIVTQAELFDTVRSLPSVRAAQHYCSLKLVAMDDVLSHPRFYGYTITHSLYRGFSDLGELAKDVWCLFLNADFILADGSYRALARHMLEGERCILAPSYCTIEENVRPILEERIAANHGQLVLPPREMAGLILDNRHFTMRAKTINSRMFRIDHVDQFYYQVDGDTLLGRQIPIAVVAFRPERVPAEPVAFWDYGVISELCPTAQLCVLGDSDDFLMMELRARRAMADWLKLGWMDKTEIARSLSNWMTRDQHRCGAHPLVLHRADLPAGMKDAERALAAYFDDVMSRLTNPPRDHVDHHIWTGALELHNEWLQTHQLRSSVEDIASAARGATGGANGEARQRSIGRLLVDLLKTTADAVVRGRLAAIYRPLWDLMRAAYLTVFGRLPDVSPLHPQHADLWSAMSHLATGAGAGTSALAVWGVAGASVAPQLGRWARHTVNADPAEIADPASFETLRAQGPFDLCFLELSKEEFLSYGALHSRLRDLVRKGGRVIVFCQLRGMEQVVERDFALISGGFPERDTAELHFRGGFFPYVLQRVWDDARVRAQSGRAWDLIRLGLVSALVAPLSLIANRVSLRRQPGKFPGYCTSLLLVVRVA